MGLDLEVATVGSRGVAYLLDLIVLAVGFVLLSAAQAAFGSQGFVPGSSGIAIALLLLFAWQFGYPIGFETLMGGRTPGKAAMGLRVITLEGAPPGVRHAAIRAATAVVELLGTVGAVAIISSFVSVRGQRLGDLAAGTLVIRERRAVRELEAVRFTPPSGQEAYAASLDVSALTSAEYAAVRDALRRSPQLPPSARESVMNALASRLLPRVRPAPEASMAAETWLTCVAAAVQSASVPVGRAGSSTGPPVDPPPPRTPPPPPDGGETPPAGFAPPG